jgi:hypothetical protein
MFVAEKPVPYPADPNTITWDPLAPMQWADGIVRNPSRDLFAGSRRRRPFREIGDGHVSDSGP